MMKLKLLTFSDTRYLILAAVGLQAEKSGANSFIINPAFISTRSHLIICFLKWQRSFAFTY